MKRALATLSIFIAFANTIIFAEESKVLETDTNYQNTNKEFDIISQASMDVGSIECKSDGKELPRSLKLWFDHGKRLTDNEKYNLGVYTAEVARIEKQMQDTSSVPNKNNLQTDSLVTLAGLLDQEADFLNGKRGRIQIRKDFLVEIKYAGTAAAYEHKQWLKTFDKKLIAEGLNKALEIAKEGCEAEEKVESCEEAQSQIKAVINLAEPYKQSYLKTGIPSKTTNDDLKTIEANILAAANAIPNSPDENFDWKDPAIKAIETMAEMRKSVIVFCPESKSSLLLEKSVKIADLFEDPKLTPEEKSTQMKKVDINLASSLLNGSLTLADLKLIPTEWNRQNLLFGQPHTREPFMIDLEKRMQALLTADQQKLKIIQEKRSKILKMMMDLGNLSKYKLDLQAECGSNPNPGTYVCPSTFNNPLCNANSSESENLRKYNACKNNIEQHNNQIDNLDSARDDIKNNPNVVGVESYYLGSVGPLWRAKIQNADGTFSYKDISSNDSASKSGSDYSGSFSGVQNSNTQQNTPSSSSSGGTGNSGSSTNPTDSKAKEQQSKESPSKTTSNKSVETKNFCGLSPCTPENKKTYDDYANKIAQISSTKIISPSTLCGANPCVISKDTKTCNVAEEDLPAMLNYNLCASAAREHNARLDASINLSNYLKTHPDYIGIERSPDDNLWKAKMKNETQGIYYLPLNFKPE